MGEETISGEMRVKTAVLLGASALKAMNISMDQIAQIAGPNGERFALDLPLPGLPEQRSANQISEQLAATVQLLGTLETIKNTILIPESDIAELGSRAGELKTSVDRLASTVTEFVGNGTVTGLDVNALKATNSAGQAPDFGALVIGLFRPSQALLISVRRLLPDRKGSELRPLTDTVAELNAIRTGQRAQMAQMAENQKALEQVQEQLRNIYSSAERHFQQIAELAEQAPTFSEQLSNALKEATALVQQIAAIEAQAKALHQTVSNYQTEFDKFALALETREKQFRESTIAFEKMLKDNAEAEKELDRIVSRARLVLGEATVAGLSDRFAGEAKSLNTSLKWAQRLFFLGIALLLFSAGVVLDLFPWLSAVAQVQFREPPSSENIWPNLVYLVGSLSGKIVFLLPSALLIGFSAKWYAALFRLRKEYSYKYTVAASVPGFKVEAPEFSGAIAAMAFQQLMQNSPELEHVQGETKDADVGSSLLQRFLEPHIAKAVERSLAKFDGTKA